MGELITAREAAARSGRSHSQIHRDANAGGLPIALEYPGYNGARLFDADAVDAYAKEHRPDETTADGR